MKIFLTGGSGFLGSNFINAIPKKITIFAITRNKKNLKKNILGSNINWIEGKLTGEYNELHECDIFIHFAAYGVSPSLANIKKAININVTQSLKLFEQAANKGIKKFIVIGSSQEYGNMSQKGNSISVTTKLEPYNNYGISKKIAFNEIKKFCKKRNLLVTYLRVFNTYGIGQNKKSLYGQLYINAKKGKNFRINNQSQKIDISHVEYVTNKIVKYLKFKENIEGKINIVNIGGNKLVTVRKFAQIEWKKLNAKGSLIYK